MYADSTPKPVSGRDLDRLLQSCNFRSCRYTAGRATVSNHSSLASSSEEHPEGRGLVQGLKFVHERGGDAHAAPTFSKPPLFAPCLGPNGKISAWF